jgi:hypothetical protein
VLRAWTAPTAVRAESLWSEREDGTVRRAAAVQMAVEAAVPREPAPLPGAQTLVAVRAPAATAMAAAHRACPVSWNEADTQDEAAARHRVVMSPAYVRLTVSQASRQRPEAPVVARCAAASPADVLPARVDARVAAPCPVPRCEAESSAEQIALLAMLEPQALQTWGQEPLRQVPQRPVVLRQQRVRARSRLGVLHRFQ